MRKTSGIRHVKTSRFISSARTSFMMFAICLLTFGAVPAFAQEVTGSIVCQVNDEQGSAVAGATVELVTSQRTFTTTTDGSGGYSFLTVIPGAREIKVSAAGFGSQAGASMG